MKLAGWLETQRLLKVLLAAVALLLMLLGGSHLVVSPVKAADVPDAVLKAEQQRIAAIAKAKRAAVGVFARGGQGGGSGVVVTPDGYALTNFHVVKPCGSHMKCSMPDGQLYDAVIVGIDAVGDVALIKLLGREDFPTAEMGDSDDVRVGDWCFAVGNPFLLATDFQPTVTYGLVSGTHRWQEPAGSSNLLEYTDCIQTDASINPGNSGGPLFNAQGQLIGINGRGSFEKRGRVNVGVGYAISINQIKKFMGYLHSGRIVDHATLGATVSTDDNGRVLVQDILESSDAFRRGLRYEDQIVSFAGRAITSANAFKNILGTIPKGWRVPLTYARDGQLHDIYVRLPGVHVSQELYKLVQGPQQAPVPEQPGDKPPEGQPNDGEPKEDEPKEGEPKEDKPNEGEPQPNERPRQPGPRPGRPAVPPRAEPAEPTPPEIAKLIKDRIGFANYYFNELNRDRVWDAFRTHGDFQGATGAWTLRGQLATGEAIELSLGSEEVAGNFPGGPARVDLEGNLDTQLDPPGSGGLLIALHQWQRLLSVGPRQFGDLFYLGSAPVVGREGLHDILVGTSRVIESRFYFDPQSGLLSYMEMYPDINVDPCEIYFDQYQDVQGRLLPHRMEVRFGDQLFATLEWKEFIVAPVETTVEN